MEEILQKLANLSTALDAIQWESDLSEEKANEIKGKMTEIDEDFEKAIEGETEITSEDLGAMVEKYGALKQTVAEGIGRGGATESDDSLKRKDAIEAAVKSRYSRLFSQKELIEQYVQKYDPQNLIRIKEAEKKDNEKEMERKEKTQTKIRDIETKKESDFTTIREGTKTVESINEALKLVKQIKDIDSLFETLEADGSAKQRKEAERATIATQLNQVINSISNVKYIDDMSQLESDLNNEKTSLTKKMQEASQHISDELQYRINTGDIDLETYLGKLTGKTHEEILSTFQIANNRIRGEIAKLGDINKQYDANISTLDGSRSPSAPSIPGTSGDPSATIPIRDSRETEMMDDINNNDEYNNAIQNIENSLMTTDKKQRRELRYKFLKAQKGLNSTDNRRHPIMRLKARFLGKDIDQKMIETAKKKVFERYAEQWRQEHPEEATPREKWKSQYVASVTKSILRTDKDSIDEDLIIGEAYNQTARKMDEAETR